VSKEEKVPSVSGLKDRFYIERQSAFKLFNEKAKALVTEDSIVLHAGCGADNSIGFRTTTRTTVGLDCDGRILENSDLDFAVVGDLSRLPFVDESVDFVASRWVLEHVSQPDVFFKEAARVLRPRGHLALLTTNLWHYFATMVRITPYCIQHWLIRNVLDGNPDDVFPTFYRANTVRRIRSLAAEAGLVEDKLELLEGAPSILGFSVPTYLAGIAYERTVNRFEQLAGLRAAILAVFHKAG
jgi:SAM-dependent methyltransferase